MASKQAKGWSVPATSLRVVELLGGLDWRTARVADVGAGRGHFSKLLSDRLRGEGLSPDAHVFPCDVIPASFEVDELTCRPIDPSGRLPFEDGQLDAVVSIEVVEHVEDQFAFFRELHRIAKPGARVIVTTPNTMNMNSRVRSFLHGFPLLFEPLPLDEHDPRRLGGHIHPIAPYYLAYGALRAGLVHPTFHPDRIKTSAALLALPLLPLIRLGGALHRRRLRRKQPNVLRDNAVLLETIGSWSMLTCRTTVLQAWRPAAAA